MLTKMGKTGHPFPAEKPRLKKPPVHIDKF